MPQMRWQTSTPHGAHWRRCCDGHDGNPRPARRRQLDRLQIGLDRRQDLGRLENEMKSMYKWMGIYRQYRRAGHRVSYAAQIASGIVFHGLPF